MGTLVERHWKLQGQQLRFGEGEGSTSVAGMPGALRPGQSRGFVCVQTEQLRAVMPNLDHAGWQGEQGTESTQGHVCYRAPGVAEATNRLGAGEAHPLSEQMSSFCRCFWLGEIVLDTGGFETVLRRLKQLPPPKTGVLQKPVA